MKKKKHNYLRNITFKRSRNVSIISSFNTNNGDSTGAHSKDNVSLNPIAILVKQRPIVLFGKQIKPYWFSIAGALGVGADVFSYYQCIDQKVTEPFIFVMLMLFCQC